MLATERTAVAQVNQLARARLVARGDLPRRARTYRAPDDHREIALGVSEQVILCRNDQSCNPTARRWRCATA
jgi:hypothetical protein